MFQYSEEQFDHIAQQTLELARAGGATAAEVDVHESFGQSVDVRWQETEQIEYQQDTSVDVTVYCGARTGRASTADTSGAALAQTVQAALNIARYTAEDPFAGLADPALLARDIQDLQLYHPWNLSVDAALEWAMRCEDAALSLDERLNNTEGANVYTGLNQYAYANTLDFYAYERSSRHSISCAMLAEENGQMQRDYWYDSRRNAALLDSPESIGRMAGERTLARLGARQIATGQYRVVFDATVANTLVGHLISALGGGAQYRKTTFLPDSLGQKILPEFFNLREEPHIKGGFASTYYDAEGVATRPRFVIEKGVVNGYFLGSYSARKLNMTSTGNAGGVHNLVLAPTHPDQASLLKDMGTGFLVTELMGQGVNGLTGDYSRGAAGFWVEDGVILHAVEEVTLAGRLQDMFQGITGIGADSWAHATHRIGSIAIERMVVAGKQ